MTKNDINALFFNVRKTIFSCWLKNDDFSKKSILNINIEEFKFILATDLITDIKNKLFKLPQYEN